MNNFRHYMYSNILTYESLKPKMHKFYDTDEIEVLGYKS